MLVRLVGEIVDFDLLEIKQQIADAKNKIEVASVNNFVNHRPIETLNAPVIETQTSVSTGAVCVAAETVESAAASDLDSDEREWNIPEEIINKTTPDESVDGAAEAAANLVKGARKSK